MKSLSRTVIVALAVVGIAVAAAPAWAGLIAYDSFGTSGTLNGSSANSSGFTAAWTAHTAYTLASSSLAVPIGHLPTSGGSISLFGSFGSGPFPYATRPLSTSLSPTSGQTWYVGFEMGDSSATNPWGGLAISIDVSGTKYIETAMNYSAGKKVQLGMHDGSGVWHSVLGTTIIDTTPRFYVMKVVTQTSGTVDAYLKVYQNTDTLPGTEPGTWDLHLQYGGLTQSYGYVRIRGNPQTASGTALRWDELRIGTTWNDAFVPEPSSLALLACGLAGLLCYAWRKRK